MMERNSRARMYTYKPKLGDVVVWPNGVEMNYDAITQSVVVLHPKSKQQFALTPTETAGVWLLGKPEEEAQS